MQMRLPRGVGAGLSRPIRTIWNTKDREPHFLPDLSMPEMWQDLSQVESRLDAKRIADLLLPQLGSRLRQIIERRFMDGATLAEVGDEFGLSLERIRQIEAKALRHMRRWIKHGELK